MSGGARPDLRTAVRVPATSANLGPGFDALGVALGLHLVAGATARGPVRVRTHGEGSDELAEDDGNLVWASLVRFCAAYQLSVPDVSLEVCNAIPLERGLGSSSAAIVAGLALGRSLTGVVVGDRELVQLADEIEGHPDNVAPAILGGFVSSTRTAEGELVARRARPDPTTRVVVAIPRNRQNTDAARSVLPDSLSRADAVMQAGRAAHVTGALTGTWPVHAGAAGDQLHEPGRFEVMQDSGRLARAWRAAGLHAWLSGAGPAVAAVIPASPGDAQQRAMALGDTGGFTTRVLEWDLSGTVACAPGRCAFAGREGCATCPRRGLC